MSDSTKIKQHTRMAMGSRVAGYKRGGSVTAPPSRPSQGAVNPLRGAKQSNGIPGMKKGGKC